MTEPKWLELARQDLGVDEIAGPKANPRIMEYYRAAHANWAKDDSVPWCGAAMAAWVAGSGYTVPAEAARARAWLDWGVPLTDPKKGAVAVFRRGADEKSGHVTLFVEDRGDRVLCLGGNQGDAVSMTAYPKRDLLGYRWPAGADVPKVDVPTVLPPARPLPKSGTIWGSVTAGGAATAAYAEGTMRGALEAVAELNTMAPVKAAILETGANSKAVALGLSVFAVFLIISRRIKAAVEGRAG
jgi:uncharacterized protein (TIGR02594 family)